MLAYFAFEHSVVNIVEQIFFQLWYCALYSHNKWMTVIISWALQETNWATLLIIKGESRPYYHIACV